MNPLTVQIPHFSQQDPVKSAASTDPKLLQKAKELEAAFLTEMLKAAGLGKPVEGFGGGAGEDAFAGFLVGEYATQMVDSGGIGLAEAIVRALSEGQK